MDTATKTPAHYVKMIREIANENAVRGARDEIAKMLDKAARQAAPNRRGGDK